MSARLAPIPSLLTQEMETITKVYLPSRPGAGAKPRRAITQNLPHS